MANRGKKSAGAAKGAGQPDKVVAFLIGLATDPARLGRYIQSPDAELEAAGIDEADRAVLKSGNPAAIHARIGGQPAAAQPNPLFMLVATDDEGAPHVAQAMPTMMMPTMAMMSPMMMSPMMTPMMMMPMMSTPTMMPMMMTANTPAPAAAPHAALGAEAASPTLPMAPPYYPMPMPMPMPMPSPYPYPMPMMMSPTMMPIPTPMPSPYPMPSPFPFPSPMMMSPMMMSQPMPMPMPTMPGAAADEED